MEVLENAFLKVSVSAKGAELISIVNKEDGTEHIWQGNPDFWGYHAPHLFPIVGGLQNDSFLFNEKSYVLKRHGFARTSTFRKIEAAPQQAIFRLRFDEETLKVYPFKFEFQVIYHLKGRQLDILYKVINMDAGDIYFSVGAHPAFNVPMQVGETFEDYSLIFEGQNEALFTHQLSDSGLFNGKTVAVPLQNQQLDLNYNLFQKDALVFKHIEAKAVTLKSRKSNKLLRVAYPHFEHLGIWTKENAPFLCIEPWLGIADSEGEPKDFSVKEGIQKLKHGHVFETVFSVSL